MLDFTELPVDGDAFELLIREILFSRGVRVYWSGKGPDGGRDLVAIDEPTSELRSVPRRWLVQCKHFAHARRAVGVADLDQILDSCRHHGATGYLLACSTFPSSALVARLEGIGNEPSSGIVTAYWDSALIERKLQTPRSWAVAQRFFPRSAAANEGSIYATDSPNRWTATFGGCYFHVHSRVSSSFDHHFDSLRMFIGKMGELAAGMGCGHLLRPRAVSNDDKNGNFHWSIDYLYQDNESPRMMGDEIAYALGDGRVLEDGQGYSVDVHLYQYDSHSDYYDPDSSSYYDPFRFYFWSGLPRPPQYQIVVRSKKTWVSDRNAPDRDGPFESMMSEFRQLHNVRVIRGINASVEELDRFTTEFDWSHLILTLKIEKDLFLSARVMLVSSQFEHVTELCAKLPISIERSFALSTRFVVTPDQPPTADDVVYEITFSLHPCDIRNAHTCRANLNAYFGEVAEAVRQYRLGLGKS